MAKQKLRDSSYENCLRDFGHLFRTDRVLKNQAFVKQMQKENPKFAAGYVLGLGEALSLLKEMAIKHSVPLQDLGIEDVSIEDIHRLIEQ